MVRLLILLDLEELCSYCVFVIMCRAEITFSFEGMMAIRNARDVRANSIGMEMQTHDAIYVILDCFWFSWVHYTGSL